MRNSSKSPVLLRGGSSINIHPTIILIIFQPLYPNTDEQILQNLTLRAQIIQKIYIPIAIIFQSTPRIQIASPNVTNVANMQKSNTANHDP